VRRISILALLFTGLLLVRPVIAQEEPPAADPTETATVVVQEATATPTPTATATASATLTPTPSATITPVWPTDTPTPTVTWTPTPGCADGLEPNDLPGQGEVLVINQSLNGLTLAPVGDVDFFLLWAKSGRLYQLTTTTGDGLDTRLRVFDPTGRLLAQNDDYTTGNPASQVRFQAPGEGWLLRRPRRPAQRRRLARPARPRSFRRRRPMTTTNPTTTSARPPTWASARPWPSISTPTRPAATKWITITSGCTSRWGRNSSWQPATWPRGWIPT